MPRVLIIEADQETRDALVRFTAEAGHAVDAEAAVEAALAIMRTRMPAIVLASATLGSDAFAAIRAACDDGTRVVAIADASTSPALGVGSERGPHDVLPMPFTARALAARIAKHTAATRKPFRFRGLVVDPIAGRIELEGQRLLLTRIEKKLLLALVASSPNPLSRGQLLTAVWEADAGMETRTVDTHVLRLRYKLGEARDCVESVRRKGYRIRGE